MEIWKDIKGYEERYLVSSKGRIKSLGNNQARVDKILKGSINTTGYIQVYLSKNRKQRYLLVSRLVCINFLPNPEGKRTVNHKDGNTVNNNLEWATYSENHKHAYKFLGKNSGSKLHPRTNRKLSKKQVLEIRKKLSDKQTYRELGLLYNVSQDCIWRIKSRKTYNDCI